jgi:hypothetical protein
MPIKFSDAPRASFWQSVSSATSKQAGRGRALIPPPLFTFTLHLPLSPRLPFSFHRVAGAPLQYIWQSLVSLSLSRPWSHSPYAFTIGLVDTSHSPLRKKFTTQCFPRSPPHLFLLHQPTPRPGEEARQYNTGRWRPYRDAFSCGHSSSSSSLGDNQRQLNVCTHSQRANGS